MPPDDSRREAYAALTATAESIGLFDEPKRIGYRRQWLALVREKGYRIEGHALVPLGNDESDSGAADEAAPRHTAWQASRHLTALVRYGFSAPVQSLARHGFLDGSYRLFDYGCGRGDDVRGLLENGLTAAGWDPFHAADNPIHAADIVNLGFVINVIEDFDERIDALTRAWSLTEHLLVVSVMLANQNDPRGQQFRDGIMTQRGTFQKYFSQSEIKGFLEQVLEEEAIPVAPGVLYVFRDKDAEQRFLLDRDRSKINRLRQPSSRLREKEKRIRRNRAAERYDAYREPLDRLWDLWLTLGRKPDKSEVDDLVVLTEGFGSLSKALRFLEERGDQAEIERASASRVADLEVYFALNQFEQRKPSGHRASTPGIAEREVGAGEGELVPIAQAARERLDLVAEQQVSAGPRLAGGEQGLGFGEFLLRLGHGLGHGTAGCEQQQDCAPGGRLPRGCSAESLR